MNNITRRSSDERITFKLMVLVQKKPPKLSEKPKKKLCVC